MSTTKQKSSAGKNVLVFFIVFIIFEMLIIFGISQIFKNKDSAPSLMGYSFYIMNNSNMGDEIPQGTLVVSAEGIPTFEDAGKAYLCRNVEGEGTGIFRLSSVVSEKAGKDGVIYKFYQNNDKTKFYDVKSDDIVGNATVHFVGLGKAITFVKSKFGMIVCAAVPLVILLVLEIIIAFATHKPKEDYEEDDDEPKQERELDDFLFGGKDEGQQIAKRRKMRELEAEKTDDDESDDEDVEEEEKQEESPAAVSTSAETVSEEKAEEVRINTNPYYEKASQLIDGTADETSEEKEKQQSEAELKGTINSENGPKVATTSISDLMKLMEAEQDKLKKQLNKNQPKQ